jgi:hypothetical protein
VGLRGVRDGLERGCEWDVTLLGLPNIKKCSSTTHHD